MSLVKAHTWQVEDCSTKHKALNSSPNVAKKKKKKEEEEKEKNLEFKMWSGTEW
jgi:hypothetical protein